MNTEIKSMIREAGLHQWQIAKSLGVTAGTLTVWLRDEPLPENRRKMILDAIRKEAEKHGTVNN